MNEKVIIVMGSSADLAWGSTIKSHLKTLGINLVECFVASAHKNPKQLLRFIESVNETRWNIVIIAVAARSNALGGFIDGATHFPVINCPPKSNNSLYEHDVWSSLRMPSGIGCVTVLEPEAAAIAAAKILALSFPKLEKNITDYQEMSRTKAFGANRDGT